MADILTLLSCYFLSTFFVIVGIVSLVYALKRRQTFYGNYENHENRVLSLFVGLAAAVTVLGMIFFLFSIGACLSL
jgi:uncharacterized membrane protein HdeD (DUF308 family)